MVSGVKKSSSLPILFDKELNNFDTNKSTNNRYNNRKEDNCKYNSLMRNNNNHNTLKINSKLFYNNNNNEQKEKKNCTAKKLKISESGLDSFRFLTTPRKTNIINHSSTLSINDQLQQISLTDSLKKKINNVLREPVRVIKITEIIEIKDSEYKDNNNNNTRAKQIEMSPHSTTSTADSNESNDDSDNNNNNKNTQHESNLNKTFIKSPPISRKIESRSKQHQIHSTTHVKSSDYFNFNHFNKQDTEKKRNENINDNILMEIFKLTNKSLHQLETNKYNQQQLSGTNTFNSLNRQQSKVQEFKSNQSENEDGIPVVHNFSFIDKNSNLPQNDPNNKPKRILIKITGRTRSSSNDPKNLINKVNLNLGKYQLDQVYSQQNQNNYSRPPIQLKIHRLEKKSENSIPNNNNNESNTFSVDKFKSYLNNLKETDVNNNNRSLSTPPPSERNILNEKLIDNQINKLKSTPNRSSPARKIEQMPNGDWIETFKPEPDFSSDLGSVNKPFQSNQHMSLIKNAGDIIYNKTSAFNTVNINNNNDQNESFVPVWTFRENNKNTSDKFDTDASKSIKDKANNLGSFSCGLISPRPKNLNIVLDENLTINDEYDYSPTFYPSENHLADEMQTSNKNKIVKNSSNQNKFAKKVSSYYNDYYRDLFLNQNVNNSNKNSEFTHNNNLEISTKYEASKYIDDEEDTSTDTNLESYNENHSVFEKFKNNLYENTTLPMNNLITKRSNLTTNHESMNNNEISPRTTKLSRRVIFADECYK